MPSPNVLDKSHLWVPIDSARPIAVSGSFKQFPVAEPVLKLQVTDVPAAGYYSMLQRNSLNRRTEGEIARRHSVAAETVRLLASYSQVTLLENKPHYPGYSLVTEYAYGDNYENIGRLVTTDVERPFSDLVTTHLGLRARDAGLELGRRVLDIDGLNAMERRNLTLNSLPAASAMERVWQDRRAA